MRIAGIVVALVLASTPCFAQPGCHTEMLPDLGPFSLDTPITGPIVTGFMVPPMAEAGPFYPAVLWAKPDGTGSIDQPLGVGEKRSRPYTNITRVSLVWWRTEYFAPEGSVKVFAYKVLPSSTPIGVYPNPTGAFRETGNFSHQEENKNLSTPVQLGEVWNFHVENWNAYPIYFVAQIEASICGDPGPAR